VTLNSARGETNGSQLSESVWDIDNAISTPDNNYAASVGISTMSFFNSFNNIAAPTNILKYFTTWTEGGTPKALETTVRVGADYYTETDLKTVLNTIGLLNHIENTFYYGMGYTGPSPTAPINLNSSNRRFILQSATPANLGVVDVNHTYVGFYLIVDDDTLPMMKRLGFANTGSNGELLNAKVITEASPIIVGEDSVNLYGVGFKYEVDAGGSYIRDSGYNYEILSPNFLNMTSALSLEVRLESVHSQVRTGQGLRRGDTLGIVPVTNNFGSRCYFEAANPMNSIMTNLNLSRFRITIRDAATGKLVDFNGVDWVINLKIEFIEISNDYLSANGQEGTGRKMLPMFHHEAPNHFQPHSGMKKSRLI